MSDKDYTDLAAKLRLAIESKQSFNLPLVKMHEFKKLLIRIKSEEV